MALILIILFLLFRLENKKLYPIQSLLMKPFTVIHRVFGIRHTISFVTQGTSSNSLSDTNEFLLSDVFGLGFYGYNSLLLPIDTYFRQFAQIVILLNDGTIIPIGGFYGFFFTQKPRVKKEFEYFYLFLADIFQLQDDNFHFLKTVPFDITIGSWRSNEWSSNTDQKEFRFKKNLEELRNIGFFEAISMVYLSFMMVCAYFVENITSSLFDINSSMLMLPIMYAFLIRLLYFLYWFMYLILTVKPGGPKHYFKFEKN